MAEAMLSSSMAALHLLNNLGLQCWTSIRSSGTTLKWSSTFPTPIVLSIASTSACVCGVNMGLAVLAVSVVSSRIHQFIELGLIDYLDFGEPTAGVGFGV